MNPVVNHIINQSNLYATQNNKILKLTKKELFTYIIINLCIGVIKYLSVPVVSKIMNRNRFNEIVSNIHVNNNPVITVNKNNKQSLRPAVLDSLYKTLLKHFMELANSV